MALRERYVFKVSVPALGGQFSFNFDELKTHETLVQRYGGNTANVKLLLVTWTALLSDSPLCSPKPSRVYHRFVSRGIKDVQAMIGDLARLAHDLTKSLGRSADSCMTTVYLKEFEKTPVYREYLEFFRTHDPRLLQYLLSFLSFGKKTAFAGSDLEDTAFRKWSQVEEKLGTIQLYDPTLKNMRIIIDHMFREWEFDHFLPAHSGGAVAERRVRGLMAKTANMAFDPKIEYLYLREDNIFLPNETGWIGYPASGREAIDVDLDKLIDYTADISSAGSEILKTYYPIKSRRASRLKFVPKNFKTCRSICMEPTIYMWAQQAVRLVMEHQLDRNAWLRNHVQLESQEVSQEGARYGSITGLTDTIDLSSASDSVSWQLVKKVFKPSVLKHLYATRTDTVELPNGVWTKVHKYAPMGSALCFPVQCVLYTAVTILCGIAWIYNRNWRSAECLNGLDLDEAYNNSFYRTETSEKQKLIKPIIYGDDIIIDHRVVSSVVECLISLGFEVNKEKSYYGEEAYRESCGEHYALGARVTPYVLKLKRITESEVDPEVLGGVIDQANHALKYGYVRLRQHLINFCLWYPIAGFNAGRRPRGRNPILFTNDREASFALHCEEPRNLHLRRRAFSALRDTNGTIKKSDTHIHLQRQEWHSVGLESRDKVSHDESVDEMKYIAWWRSRYHAPRGDGVINSLWSALQAEPSGVVTADTFGSRAKWRWTPA